MSNRELCNTMLDDMPDYKIGYVIAFMKGLLAEEEVPNAETLAAIQEVEEMRKHPENYKGYTDVDEMFRELLA